VSRRKRRADREGDERTDDHQCGQSDVQSLQSEAVPEPRPGAPGRGARGDGDGMEGPCGAEESLVDGLKVRTLHAEHCKAQSLRFCSNSGGPAPDTQT